MVEGTHSHTSTSLIRGAKANDPEAWRRLVNTYGRRIYRWCRRSGLQPADASNVVQEVLRSVARNLSEFHHDQDGDTFRGWIRRITQNKTKDFYRKQKTNVGNAIGGTDAHRKLALQEDPFVSSPMGNESPAEQTAKGPFAPGFIEQLQMEFSHRDWQIFWRVVVGGQCTQDVADEFEISANAVRLVKMRVLRRLRELVPQP